MLCLRSLGWMSRSFVKWGAARGSCLPLGEPPAAAHHPFVALDKVPSARGLRFDTTSPALVTFCHSPECTWLSLCPAWLMPRPSPARTLRCRRGRERNRQPELKRTNRAAASPCPEGNLEPISNFIKFRVFAIRGGKTQTDKFNVKWRTCV